MACSASNLVIIINYLLSSDISISWTATHKLIIQREKTQMWIVIFTF